MNEEVNFEEVKKAKIDAVNAVKAAKKSLVKFRKENKLKADQEPEDKKLLKTLQKLVADVEAKEKTSKKAQAAFKEAKPNGGRGGFATKYDYPLVKDDKTGEEREMTKDEKKKFRAKARSEKKAAEKATQKGESKAPEKTAEKKVKKKVKKSEKVAEPEEEEDDD